MTIFLIVYSWILSITYTILSLIFVLLLVYEWILGKNATEKLLADNHFPFDWFQTRLLGSVCLAIQYLSHILRETLIGN